MSIGCTMTCDIYKADGTVHPGPSFDFNLADKNLEWFKYKFIKKLSKIQSIIYC